MRYFRLEGRGIAVAPLMEEVAALEAHWDRDYGTAVTSQPDTLRIKIRDRVPEAGLFKRDCHGTVRTAFADRIPRAYAFMCDFAQATGQEIGRCDLLKLLPGGRVAPHRDGGEFCRYRNRYHLALRSDGFYLKEGELWWFDNKAQHSGRNMSYTAPRIHMIFDLLPLPSPHAGKAQA
jgi:hypothetical protein